MNTDQGLAPDPTTQPATHSDRPVAPRPRRRGPWRWLVAGIATVLLVVSGTGLVAFAQTGAGAGRGPVFVPADAPVYVEARIDMPDGQDAALAEVLTSFPGFADSASFQLRVDELLNGLVDEATDGMISFGEDISPWVTGEIGLGVMDLSTMSGGDPDIILGIGVSDHDAASAFVTTLADSAGMELTEETYGGFGVISGEGATMMDVGQDAAVTVTDDFLLIGTSADLVKQSIDVLAGSQPSLAQSEEFQTGWARVPAGHLAAVWFDLDSFADLITAAMSMTGQPGPAGMADALVSQLPKDMTAYLAAAPDGLTIEAFITTAEGGLMPTTGESDLASHFPADTQIYAETRDLGSTFKTAIEGLMTQMGPDDAEGLEGLEGMLGVPLPDVLDIIDDAAFGAAIKDGGGWIGIAGEVNDEEMAGDRLERLLGFIGLVASQADAGIDITQADVAGTSVTTITLPSEAIEGLPLDIGDSVSLAVSDGTLLLGTGDFVTNALGSDGSASLATSERYVSALGDATPNLGVLYADLGGLITTLDPLLAFVVDDWEDISPWLAGLDRFVAVGTADDQVISGRMTLFVD